MKLNLLKPLSVLTLSLACTAFAQRQTLSVQPDASEVRISLGAIDHATKGTFHVQKGTVNFNPATLQMDGLVTVAAGSGKTGSDGRDKKMTNEVLDATHFAEITFAPSSFEGKIAPEGDSTIQVTGTFTLHGTPHLMTVPMQIHIDGVSFTGKTHFVVPYVKWGLKDPSIFILKVAKEVEVDLTLAGALEAAPKLTH